MKEIRVKASKEFVERLMREGNTINVRCIKGIPADAILTDVQMNHKGLLFRFETADESVKDLINVTWENAESPIEVKHG